MIFPIIAVAVLSSAGILYHINKIREALWNQTVSEIMEVTDQGGHAFEVYIEKDLQILTRVAKVLSQRVSDDKTVIINTMDIFADGDIDFRVVDLDHAVLYFGDESGVEELDAERLGAFEGMTDRGLLEPYIDESGKRMIGAYQRFTFADGMSGIVEVGRSISTVEDEFMLSFYDGVGSSHIVNARGDVLICSQHKDGSHDISNMLDMLDRKSVV